MNAHNCHRYSRIWVEESGCAEGQLLKDDSVNLLRQYALLQTSPVHKHCPSQKFQSSVIIDKLHVQQEDRHRVKWHIIYIM